MANNEPGAAVPPDARRDLGPGDAVLSTAGFETLALHAGQDPDATTGAVIPPIYAVTTYAQDSVANPRQGYVYSRPANPTRRTLETCMAALEGGVTGLAFSSGMAAEDAVFRTVCRPGHHVVVPNDMYGGTYRLLDKVLKHWDVSYSAVPIWDIDEVSRAILPGRTSVVWCETPTNPLLGITDLPALSAVTHEAGALLVVDNTLASPYLQQPLDLGADIVVHSTTKYLGGHSDVVGGALVTKSAELGEKLKFHQNAMGAIPSAIDAWLTLRGLKTLGVRVERQSATAARIARYLLEKPQVRTVYYPGLEDHPGHDIAIKQMAGFGGIVSFSLRGGEPAALQVCNGARLFTLAESLGAVESLICHPLRMTHASAAGSPVAPPGDVVRLSVGLETPEDLIADLDRALNQVTN